MPVDLIQNQQIQQKSLLNSSGSDTVPQTKADIIANMSDLYKNDTYEKLLCHTQQNLNVLAEHRGMFSRGLSNYFHVDLPKSMQLAIVMLIMKKNNYSNVNQIKDVDVRIVVHDLISTSFNNGNCITYNVNKLDNHKHQIIAIVEYNQYKSLIHNLSDGIKLFKSKKVVSTPQSNKLVSAYEQLEINFSKTPEIDEKLEKNVAQIQKVIIGDTHGNTLLIIHQLVQTGVVQVKDQDKFNELNSIILDSINNWDINGQTFKYNSKFKQLLSEALEHNNNSTANVTFLGDILNDRVGNDMFTLDFLQYLTDSEIDYTIIWSNHDGDAVRHFFNNVENFRTDNDIQLINPNDGFGGEWQSQTSCVTTLNEDKTLRNRYISQMNNYLNHLVVYEYSKDTSTLRSHAPADKIVVNALARQVGLQPPEQHSTEYKVKKINYWFRTCVLNVNNFKKYYPRELNYTVSPLFATTCATGGGEFGDCMVNLGKDLNLYSRGRKFELPSDVLVNEHGHIFNKDINNIEGTPYVSLDGNFGNFGGLDDVDNLNGTRNVALEMYQEELDSTEL